MTNPRNDLDRWFDGLEFGDAPAPNARFVRRLRSDLIAKASTMQTTSVAANTRPIAPVRKFGRREWLQLAAVFALVFAWIGTIAGGGPNNIADRFGGFLRLDEPDEAAVSMFRGNNARTGVIAETGPATNPVVAWDVTPAESGFNVVNATDTTIVLSYEQDGRLVALDRGDGAERWRHDSDCVFLDTTPLIDSGVIYESAWCPDPNTGVVIALDESTGEERWRATLPGDVEGSPLLEGDTLYLLVDGQPFQVAAIDHASGVIKWLAPIERIDKPVTPPTPENSLGNVGAFSPTFGDGRLYVTTFNGVVHALDVTTREVIWSFDTGGNAVSTPAFTDGRLYLSYAGITIPDVDGGFVALDAATGSLHWQVKLPVHTPYTSPVIADGLAILSLYNLPAERRTIAWDLSTGEERWQIDLAGTTMLADGVLYLHELSTGDTVAIDPTTGETIWSAFTANYEWPPSEASHIRAEPVIQNGALITGSNAQRVLVIEAGPRAENSISSPMADLTHDLTNLQACAAPEPIDWKALEGEPAFSLVEVDENQREGLPAAIHTDFIPDGKPVSEATSAEIGAAMNLISACADRRGQQDITGLFSEDFFRRVWVRLYLSHNPLAALEGQLRNLQDADTQGAPIDLEDGRIMVELSTSEDFSFVVVFMNDDGIWKIDELLQASTHPEGKG